MSDMAGSNEPDRRPRARARNEVVYVRKVMNGFLLDIVGRNQIFVVQGDGSARDVEEMLKALKMMFEELEE